MLIQDGMNAIIVKGDYWYQVHRISDPEKAARRTEGAPCKGFLFSDRGEYSGQ